MSRCVWALGKPWWAEQIPCSPELHAGQSTSVHSIGQTCRIATHITSLFLTRTSFPISFDFHAMNTSIDSQVCFVVCQQ